MKIDHWIETGELEAHPDTESLLEEAARILDKSGASENFGPVEFVGENNTKYTLVVEARIVRADDEEQSLPDWHELVDSLKGLPITWYPALLCELAEAGYAAGTFNPGGASGFLKKWEKREGHDLP